MHLIKFVDPKDKTGTVKGMSCKRVGPARVKAFLRGKGMTLVGLRQKGLYGIRQSA